MKKKLLKLTDDDDEEDDDEGRISNVYVCICLDGLSNSETTSQHWNELDYKTFGKLAWYIVSLLFV